MTSNESTPSAENPNVNSKYPPVAPKAIQIQVIQQLLFCLDKLLNVLGRRQKLLRNKCLQFRHKIQSLKKEPNSGDEYWLIFEICCKCQIAHVVEIAIDCTQKLFAASIFTGKTYVTFIIKHTHACKYDVFFDYSLDMNGKPLIDSMVKTICDCVSVDSPKVQLQVMLHFICI